MTGKGGESVLSSSKEELRVNVSFQSSKKRGTYVSTMEDTERPSDPLTKDIFPGMLYIDPGFPFVTLSVTDKSGYVVGVILTLRLDIRNIMFLLYA